jgi:electron transport complex protein RnfG
MEKLKSSFTNMFLVLTCTAAAAGALLAAADHYTSIPIARANDLALQQAIRDVAPPYDNDPLAEVYLLPPSPPASSSPSSPPQAGSPSSVIPAKAGTCQSSMPSPPPSSRHAQGTPATAGLRIYPAKLNGRLTGAAVQISTPDGFAGPIEILVGFDTAGLIINYSVLQHTETPGLGAKMQQWFRTPKGHQNILGRPAGSLALSKDGGDVDAITASTISSRAFLHAINRACNTYLNPPTP